MNPVLGAALPPMDFDDPRVAAMLAPIIEAKISEQVGLRVPAMKIGAVQDVLADGTVVVQAHGPGNDGTPMPFLGGTPVIGELVRTYRWAQSRGTTPSFWAEPFSSVSPSARNGFYPGKITLDVTRDYGGKADAYSDNKDRIAAAIADAKAAGGAVVYLGPGTWITSDPMVMEDAASSVLMGAGSSQTKVIYTGGGGSVGETSLLSVRSVDGYITKVTSVGVIGLTLDGQGLLPYVMRVKTVNQSLFSDLVIKGGSSWQMYWLCLDTRAGGADALDNQNNDVRDIRLICTGAQNGMKLHGSSDSVVNTASGGNTSLNHYANVWVNVVDGDAIVLGNSDGNTMTALRTAASGTGRGLVFQGSNTTLGGHARNNHVYGVQSATAGTYFEGTGGAGMTAWTRVSQLNLVSFNTGNTGDTHGPAFGTGAEPPVNSVISERVLMGFVGSQLIVTNETSFGNVYSRALTEKALLGSESLRIYNSASAHVRLTDDTNEWGISIDSATGDVRVLRISGSGIIRFGSGTGAVARFSAALRLVEQAVPATPPSGELALYADTGHKLHAVSPAGVDMPIPTSQGARVSLASINAAATHTDTVTWGSAFADANYTAVISYVQTTLAAHHVTGALTGTPVAASISVRTMNEDTAARAPVLHAVAVHD